MIVNEIHHLYLHAVENVLISWTKTKYVPNISYLCLCLSFDMMNHGIGSWYTKDYTYLWTTWQA